MISDESQLAPDPAETKRRFPLRSEVMCQTNPSLEFPQSGPVIALPLVELPCKDEMTQSLGLVRAFLFDHPQTYREAISIAFRQLRAELSMNERRVALG